MGNNYIYIYKVLDYCYSVCEENDLGGLLGELSPDIFEDGLPADMATYDDWIEVASKHDDLKTAIICFLENYEKVYGFCFYKTKQCLSSIDNKLLDKLMQ